MTAHTRIFLQKLTVFFKDRHFVKIEGFLLVKNRFLLGLAGFMLIAISPVFSSAWASDDVFVVPRVSVAEQGKSAIEAKRMAEIKGRRVAMDTLLRRIVARDDWEFLPNLAQGVALIDTTDRSADISATEDVPGQGQDFDPYNPNQQVSGRFEAAGKQIISLDDRQLQSMEQSFEVNEEKSSPTTYRAFITYSFKPDEVRNLLINASIPYSETQTRSALVLPVLETTNGLYLWERNNPWLRAWQNRILKHELTPVSAPLGDLEDTGLISAKQAMRLDKQKLQAIAERYGVAQVIIAHAKLRQENGNFRLQTKLINGYRESGNVDSNDTLYPADRALDNLATRTRERLSQTDGGRRPLGNNGQGALTDIITEQPGTVLAEKWLNAPAGNFPGLADEAIGEVITLYSDKWKAQTLIDHSISTVLYASAFFQSLEEWKRIRSALISTPLVGSVQIANLSRDGAQMSIQAYGDPGKLVVAMEAQGVRLWTYDEGALTDLVWNIATPETASSVPIEIQRARPQQRRNRARRSIFGESDAVDNNQFPFEAEVQEAGYSDGVEVNGALPARKTTNQANQ